MIPHCTDTSVFDWLFKLETPATTPTSARREREAESEGDSGRGRGRENERAHQMRKVTRKRESSQDIHRPVLAEFINLTQNTMPPQESPRRRSPRKKGPILMSHYKSYPVVLYADIKQAPSDLPQTPQNFPVISRKKAVNPPILNPPHSPPLADDVHESPSRKIEV